MRPSAIFSEFIQRPGRGIRAADLGNRATNSQGMAIPSPSARKISHSSCSGAASAKATAVPRKGAEQGVASSVAKMPSQKLPAMPVPPAVAIRLTADDGSSTSKTPNRLSEKINVTAIIKPINQGFWNWIPQPRDAPVSFSIVTISASRANEVRIPALVARKRRPIARLSDPDCSTALSFMPITGNTQGIRLRINPPIRAKSSIFQRLTVEVGARSAPIVRLVCCAFAPFVSTNDSAFPARVAGSSPHSLVTGTVTLRLAPSVRRRGAPAIIPPSMGSKKIAGFFHSPTVVAVITRSLPTRCAARSPDTPLSVGMVRIACAKAS